MKACLPSLHIQRPQTSNGFSNQLRVSVFTEKKINRKDYHFFPFFFVFCVYGDKWLHERAYHLHVTYDPFTVQKCWSETEQCTFLPKQLINIRLKMVSYIFYVFFLALFFNSDPGFFTGKKSLVIQVNTSRNGNLGCLHILWFFIEKILRQ